MSVREPPPAVVQLFPTCLANELLPEIAIAAVRLLERAGVRVEVPAGLTCCGQSAWNAGFVAEAKSVARRTLALLAATQGPIVIPSGSCGDMLVHQMAELFRDEPKAAAQARVVGSRVVELTQFLASLPSGAAPASAAVAASSSAATAPPLRVAQDFIRSIDGLRLRQRIA